ncbi:MULTISPECIES: transposase [Haloarcula]|uniref:transposase n=1 Tax=Haloarcula TaxID=2237 RepID=UPI00322022D3
MNLTRCHRHNAVIRKPTPRSCCGSNKTVAGIAREVIPASGKRTLNKFLTEYDWDEQQFNHERLEELQKHGETRWSKDGYIILDDTITEKAGDEVPGVGRLYDHAENDTIWAKTSSTPFTLTTKQLIHSLSASTNSKMTRTTATTRNTIWPERLLRNSKKR